MLALLLTPQTIQDLLLLRQLLICLTELPVLRLSDLTINVNATLDVQVNDGFGGKNRSHRTGRIVVARENAGIGDAFAAERLDGRSLRGDNVVDHSRAMGLNIHYIFIGKCFFGGRYGCLPFASSLQQENIVLSEKNYLRTLMTSLQGDLTFAFPSSASVTGCFKSTIDGALSSSFLASPRITFPTRVEGWTMLSELLSAV